MDKQSFERDEPGNDDGPPMPSLDELVARMERGRRDIEAGRFVPFGVIKAKSEAAIEEIRRRRAARQTSEPDSV